MMQYIESQLGRWLNHIEARAVHHLFIQGLVISESPVKRTDIPAAMHSEEVAFAALVKAPESFQINEQAHQVSVAYERHEGEGIAHVRTCLENREGVFVFTSEDTRFQPLTANNWLGYVDHFRILKEARRAQ
ncbi:hypothetical protein JCM19233_6115 [Vibrio astriarenae]|nr:hypothetical protein JCM19233_6115 [Vibrio sp. C7]